MSEAAQHPHNVEREAFVERGGVMQPAPAPRFSRTAAEVEPLPSHAGEHTRDVLDDWGVDADRVAALIESDAGRHAE
jgi:alpha-methylacyl-CoA racemase